MNTGKLARISSSLSLSTPLFLRLNRAQGYTTVAVGVETWENDIPLAALKVCSPSRYSNGT